MERGYYIIIIMEILKLACYYSRSDVKINDVFRPAVSDAYAFVLNNSFSNNSGDVKKVEVTLIHNWQQEVKESQLRDYKEW